MSLRDKKNETKMNYYANKIQELRKHIDNKATFESWSIFELHERADVLKSNYNKHEQKCMAKQAENMNESEAKTFHDECNEIDDMYIRLKAQIEMRIDFLCKNPDAQEKQKEKTIESKKDDTTVLYTTKFTGSINNWFTFRNEMKAKVCNNTELNDEQKMTQLTQVCAPELLDALGTTGFEESRKKLVHRYDDKFKLTKFYTQKLFNLQKIDCPSNDNIKQMLNEINTIESAFVEIGDVTKETMM